jgi:hypothetical protein
VSDTPRPRARPAGARSAPALHDFWLTVLQSKAEGLNAYEKYIQDAEKENAKECVSLLRKLHEQDARQVQEIKDHLQHMMAGAKSRG